MKNKWKLTILSKASKNNKNIVGGKITSFVNFVIKMCKGNNKKFWSEKRLKMVNWEDLTYMKNNVEHTNLRINIILN